jgi:serine O-acetyltransferase
MKLSLKASVLADYLIRQMDYFYPDKQPVKEGIARVMPLVIERMDHCFSQIHKKYYFSEGESLFHHLNSDHYAMFLYWIANEAYKQQWIQIAEKAFLLNKALHGIDAFYSVALPEVFLFVHPVGTILGHAQYSDFFVVYQNVTVGSERNGIYPVFGKANVLYSKCSVIGKCSIGDNVTVAANSLIRNTEIDVDSVVIGSYPQIITKKNNRNNKEDFFS